MNGNYHRSQGHGVLPDKIGRPAENLFPILDFSNRAQPLQPGLVLAAISRDAPVRDAPVTLTNPFDFSRSPLGAVVKEFLWHHLLFDPRPLSTNLFLKPNSIPIPSRRLFESVPMNPQEGAPILPQQFR